jgi:superfamily II DNA or RNA helicase
MQLTFADVSHALGSTTYTKGYTYFVNEKVVKVDVESIEEDLIKYQSHVSGSQEDPYKQIVIIEQKDAHIAVVGRCNCPVGWHCKHVAASALFYIQKIQNDVVNKELSGRRLDSWLDALQDKHDIQEEKSTSVLIYRLFENRDLGESSIRLSRSRYLKNGGYGKEKQVFVEDLLKQLHSKPLPKEDEEIVKLLSLLTPPLRDEAVLSGELGYFVLQKLLKSKRLFMGSKSLVHIKDIAPRAIGFKWRKVQDSDNLKFVANISEQKTAIISVDPLCFLDKEQEGIGKLKEIGHSRAKFVQLLNAPEVKPADVNSVTKTILREMPNTTMELPDSFELIEIESTPIPKLKIVGNSDENYALLLFFVYDGLEINAYPESSSSMLEKEGVDYRITRDSEAEFAFINTLHELDLLQKENLFTFDATSLTYLETWHKMLETTLPELEAKGWLSEKEEHFCMDFSSSESIKSEVVAGSNWFDLSYDLMIDDKKVPLLPLLTKLIPVVNDSEALPETLYLSMGEGRFVTIASEILKPIITIVKELYSSKSSNASLRVNRFESHLISQSAGIDYSNAAPLFKLSQALKNFSGIQKVTPPTGLQASLREYQQQGFEWLQFLREFGFGGILADDMGLGKTLQALTHILKEKEEGRLETPILVIAPTSLMSNWKREADKFTPDLRVLILQGSERKQHFEELYNYDIVLTTYPLLSRDADVLLKRHFTGLILDEAQFIKNDKAKASKTVRQIKSTWRLCLTGTPMENHLGELWALFDFLMPEFLFGVQNFKTLFRNPIEKEGDMGANRKLNRRIKPFMLRRSKDIVAKELPAKTEILRTVPFDNLQATLYESVRVTMEKKVRDLVAEQGMGKSHITILDALLKLRQICCDPRLLKLEEAAKIEESAKLTMLLELLEELLDEGRKIIVFSQFTSMLKIIEQILVERNIGYTKLTGSTQKRPEAIDRFTSGEVSVFLISLKAGGVGLNLTEADTVIHYDPWWNPAVENQATDRAHRLGQEKPVFVYKLIIENSVEEKILEMQEKKRALSSAIYEGKGDGSTFDKDTLLDLFS